jgi:diaminopimelate decarboxylase
VLVGDGEAELVQRREQPEDLLRYDVLPARLEPVRSSDQRAQVQPN